MAISLVRMIINVGRYRIVEETVGQIVQQHVRGAAYRWLQLFLGIVCMAMVANLQYGWTLFVSPIDAKFGWGRAAIQVAFTIFVLTETWLVPIEGYLMDRFGPKPVVMAGGILVGIAWMMNAYADSLTMLYISAAIGGIGAGAVYGTCIASAIRSNGSRTDAGSPLD
jgi:OFA family oxalate/formate antiporter-like MFS transporter